MNWRKIAASRSLLLIFILALALFLRLKGIQWGLPDSSHSYSYHPDESLITRHLSYMSPTSLNPHSFINPSLHFYTFGIVYQGMRLTMGIPSLKGTVPPADMARLFLAGRILTALMGAASIFFFYRIGKRWYGENTALLAAFFLAILPLHVVHSHFLTVEVPSTFWILIAFIFLSRVGRSASRWNYVAGGVASGFAAASKYTGILCVPAFLLGHLLMHRKSGIKALWDRKAILYLAVALITFAFADPYFFLSPGEVYKDIKILFATNIQATHISYPFPLLLVYGLGIPMAIGFLFGAVVALRKHETSDIIMLSYIALAFLLIVYAGTPFSRHVVLAAPFIVLIAARGFSFIFEKHLWAGPAKWIGFGRWIRGIGVTLLAFLSVWTFLYSYGYVHLMAQRDVRDVAAEWIDSNLPAGVSVGIGKPWFYTPPVNWFRYRIVRTDFDPKQLLSNKPEYVIITDFEYRKAAYTRRYFAKNYADSERFVQILEDQDMYGIKMVFEVTPRVAGLSFKKGYPPDDWMYVYPTIRLLERAPKPGLY